MKPKTKRTLRWWHLAFAVAALFFAYQYLSDGYGEGGAAADRLKGIAWVVLALVMAVPEFVRRRKPENGAT